MRVEPHDATKLTFGAFLTTAPLLICALAWTPLLAKDEWPRVTAEELALKDVPGHPKEHAVILLREEDTDDTHPQTHYYYRIKILSEEGLKYANVEIPYWKGGQADDIQARTTRPDGSVVNFTG